MHPRRMARLNELILQTVSMEALNLKDPGLGFLTFTAAEISPDVSVVKLFYSVLGNEEEKAATREALERAKPHLRHEMGKLENLRRVPNILFVYDQSVERADRVTRLLNTIQNEKDRPDDSSN
jgi:ribosome-binding factor A